MQEVYNIISYFQNGFLNTVDMMPHPSLTVLVLTVD